MHVTPLGGASEFGLHSTLVQAKAASVCVDAGLMFPDAETPGVDHLVPDFSALAAIRPAAYFLTHGHEDHVGALSWALRAAPAPVYATAMTLAMARSRLFESGQLAKADLRDLTPGQRIELDGL